MQLGCKILSITIEANLTESGNLDSFYEYVNKKLIGFNVMIPLRDESGNTLTCNADKVALLAYGGIIVRMPKILAGLIGIQF
jgi:hypothetical protein